MSTADPTKYAEPESHFVHDRSDTWQGSRHASTVWRFHVVVDWTEFGGAREEKTIDVWQPRYLCTDADENAGAPIYGWEYDRLTDAATGEELSDEDHDSFADAVYELLQETD